MAKIILDLEKEVNHITDWIKEYFADNGSATTCAIIGMSGGKDSTVAAALCVRALGPDRVIGVMMPDGVQEDINDAREACEHLGIQSMELNIGTITDSFYNVIVDFSGSTINNRVKHNTPARIRMSMLYAVAAMVGGRVVNTCNYSEEYVGWSTKYGDAAGDFAPLHRYTVREIKAIGHYLGIPGNLIEKVPHDGMCGRTDEESFGFSYDALDDYILDGIIPDAITLGKIKWLYNNSTHKRSAIRIPCPRPLTRHREGTEWKDEEKYFTF